MQTCLCFTIKPKLYVASLKDIPFLSHLPPDSSQITTVRQRLPTPAATAILLWHDCRVRLRIQQFVTPLHYPCRGGNNTGKWLTSFHAEWQFKQQIFALLSYILQKHISFGNRTEKLRFQYPLNERKALDRQDRSRRKFRGPYHFMNQQG